MDASPAIEERQTTIEVGHFAWLTERRAAAIAWGSWIVGTALRLAMLWLMFRYWEDARPTAFGGPASYIAGVLIGTTAATVGALIVARRPRNAIGWIWVVAGIYQALTGVASVYASVATGDVVAEPAITLGWIASASIQVFPLAIAALSLALFPDGHVVSRAWRFLPWLVIAAALLRALEVSFGRDVLVLIPSIANPYRLDGALGDVLAGSIGLAAQSATFVAAAASLGIRYRRADRDGRQQLAWFVASVVVVVLAAIPLVVLTLVRPPTEPPGALPFIIFFLSLNLPPIATLIAISRYRLYEIDRIVNRAILYGSLTAILTGLFAGLVTAGERIVTALLGASSDLTVVVSAIVVAVTYHPLRQRVEAWVDRRFRYEYHRFGPYRAQLQGVLDVVDPDSATERLLREAMAALDAPKGVIVREGTEAPEWTALTVPITDGTAGFGMLALGPHRDGTAYDDADVAELREMAALVAIGLRGGRPIVARAD